MCKQKQQINYLDESKGRNSPKHYYYNICIKTYAYRSMCVHMCRYSHPVKLPPSQEHVEGGKHVMFKPQQANGFMNKINQFIISSSKKNKYSTKLLHNDNIKSAMKCVISLLPTHHEEWNHAATILLYLNKHCFHMHNQRENANARLQCKNFVVN